MKRTGTPPPVPPRPPAVLPAPKDRKPLHRDCSDVKAYDDDHNEGALRLCPHGKVQELTRNPWGPSKYWATLSPILNPIRHHRAAEALIAAGIARSN